MMDGSEFQEVVNRLLQPAGTKRRKPEASLQASKARKCEDIDPYVHDFTLNIDAHGRSVWGLNAPECEDTPIEFTASHGPKGSAAPAVQTEIDAFKLFMDDDIIARMVSSTNVAIQRHRQNEQLNTDNPEVADTCAEEIQCFLGLLLYRGLFHDTKTPTTE